MNRVSKNRPINTSYTINSDIKRSSGLDKSNQLTSKKKPLIDNISAQNLNAIKSLFVTNPGMAIEKLNEQIIRQHPLGQNLNEETRKKISIKICQLLEKDLDIYESLNKILGG